MKKNKPVDLIISIIPFVFYLFFALYDGVIWCDDSTSYVNFNGIREPLYPFCIVIFKLIFGVKNDIYLQMLLIFQSLLLAYATFSFVTFIKKQFHTNSLITICVLLIFLSVSLMCRFIAKRGSMYSNSILSESISYPLFLLFIQYLLDYLLNSNNKSYIFSITLSFLLISTRKQLYLSLFLLIIVSIFVFIKNNNIKKGVMSLTIICLLIYGGNKVFDYCFMSSMLKMNSTHISSNRFITTMIIYTADREDGKLIEDNETRDLFYSIYDECNSKDYLRNSSYSWYKRVDHFQKHYDNIQIDTLMPILKDYANTKTTSENVEVLVDNYNNTIITSLFLKELPKILLTIIDSFFAGLIITISADKSIFIIYSIVMYIIYLALLVLNIRKTGINKISLFSLLILLSIVINVLIVSTVIFNQTRYTIYNMPLFYISLLLMIYNIFINKKIENKYEENK